MSEERYTPSVLYDLARKHGLSHDRAIEAVGAGRVVCWCGSTEPCAGGAQRYIGCPIVVADFTHTRHRGDVA